VSVLVIRPGRIPAEEVATCLTEEEKARAARFKFERDASQWAETRAGMRQILGQALGLAPIEVPLVTSPNGKPLLAAPHGQLHFNLSHCEGLAILALSEAGPVGIDLEPCQRAGDVLECEASFCHPEEIRGLPPVPEERAKQLLRIWTAKEAILKALGTGLSHPPESVIVHFGHEGTFATSDIPLEEIRVFRIEELRHDLLEGFQAMIAARADAQTFAIREYL
ncbi:MAG: 4'-phosphopantetheinyl transferase superfamily protein, partial [Verrucomicrobiaceae bacterium]